MNATPRELARRWYESLTVEEHNTRARELLALSRDEADGRKALILLEAAHKHTRYAEEKSCP